MSAFTGLDVWLKDAAAAGEAPRAAAETITRMCEAAAEVSRMVARGPLNPGLADMRMSDIFAYFDKRAGEIFSAALEGAPVSQVAREKGGVNAVTAGAPVAMTLDCFNGSTNIDANLTTGSLFSFLPEAGDETFLQPGERQIAGGFFTYGPRTALIFSLGEGTQIATMDPDTGEFFITAENKKLPEDYAREYAVNASNYRHWDPAIRSYIDDMIDGADGPREQDYSMRWAASMVAETVRVLNRGGIFLYPNDMRPGYLEGRLKHLFHANPIALVIENAGGLATNGRERILEQAPKRLDQRIPVIFGSRPEVERVRRYYELPTGGMRSPLFSRRGLFR